MDLKSLSLTAILEHLREHANRGRKLMIVDARIAITPHEAQVLEIIHRQTLSIIDY